jgi:ATP-dependent DNA helicase PIF1
LPLEDIRNNNQLFGGITVMFGRDFQQTLLVVKKGSCDEIINACLQQSYIWNYTCVLPLQLNMCLLSGNSDHTGDIKFSNWLLQVGHGSELDDDAGEISIPDGIRSTSPEDLISFIYNGVDSNPPPGPDYFLN